MHFGWRVAWIVWIIWSCACQCVPSQGWLVRRILLPYILTTFWCGWLLTWYFYFYKLRSPEPCIFALYGFSAVSDLNTLRVGALFTHSLSCGYLLYSWGKSLRFTPLSDVFGGGYKVSRGTLCPAIIEGIHSFLRVSAVLGMDSKFSEDLMVLLILSLTFDRGFTFHSKWLYLVYVSLVQNVLGIFIPDSPPPEYEILDVFPYLDINFSPMGFHVADVFTLILLR